MCSVVTCIMVAQSCCACIVYITCALDSTGSADYVGQPLCEAVWWQHIPVGQCGGASSHGVLLLQEQIMLAMLVHSMVVSSGCFTDSFTD